MRPDWKDYIFFVTTMAAITLLGMLFYVFQIVQPTWEARFAVVTWASTGIVGIATISLLLWRNAINDREFREQVKTGFADRFKTGAELLAADEEVTKVSGIIVLRELALERPAEYGVIVTDLLLDYVNASGHEQWSMSPAFASKDDEKARVRYTKPPAYFRAFNSLGILTNSPELRGHVQRQDRRIEFVRTSLEGISVRRRNFAGAIFWQVEFEAAGFSTTNLQKARFVRCHFDGTTFFDSDLTDVSVRGMTAMTGSMEFSQCNLRNASLRFSKGTFEVEACDISGMSLVGQEIDCINCWAFEPPKLIRGNQTNIQVCDASSGKGKWTSEGMQRVFQAAIDCPYWEISSNGNSTYVSDP